MLSCAPSPTEASLICTPGSWSQSLRSWFLPSAPHLAAAGQDKGLYALTRLVGDSGHLQQRLAASEVGGMAREGEGWVQPGRHSLCSALGERELW